MKDRNLKADDNWATPNEIYERLNKEFKFDFDPCPYNENEITPETDGLLKDWGKNNFLNPPYSRKLKTAFIEKALEEKKKGNTTVMLLPVSTSTKLFHELILPNAADIEFVKGRIKFQKKDHQTGEFYTPKNGGMHDSMIVIFSGDKFKDVIF